MYPIIESSVAILMSNSVIIRRSTLSFAVEVGVIA